ncbi:MAG TPA: FAD-binding protein [Arachnia sp.]|nr:FAD-binding protein [Arachnia sp.]HMT85008.1 FAD-binding protein [Arachnia sp.]
MIETQPGASWSATHVYEAERLVFPRTIEELRQTVRTAERVRALGTRHSFNDIADTSGTLVSLRDLEGEVHIDRDAGTAWAPGGWAYGTVAAVLEEAGLALPNLGSLPHISVAGACVVGTHGSGVRNRNLSASVSAIEIVDAAGEIRVVDRADPDFGGSVIHLGALGVITRLRLDVLPTYLVRQDVFVDLPWPRLMSELDGILSGAYSVSVFTLFGEPAARQVWLKSRIEDDLPATDDGYFGAVPVGTGLASPADAANDNMTVRGGVPGPWAERLPHFRYDATPSNGDEIQSEYFVARPDGAAALQALRGLADEIDPLLLVSELRTVAADDQWLSPAFARDSLCLHFTWRNEPDGVRRVLPLIERALAPFDARPHWGKWFAMDAASVARLYPRLDDFLALAERIDPGGTFRNRYLERVLGLRG